MNRLKSYALFTLVCLSSLLFTVAAQASDIKGASVTVYNSGRALVKEIRSVTLPQGPASVVFKGVPATLDPTSVRASAQGMTVSELQYRFSPITTKSLLDRYVGKELTVILPDPAKADGRILRKATLISNEQQPVFLVGDEVYLGEAVAYLLPELPKDLTQEPSLTLRTRNATAGKRGIRLSYLMGGLQWRADYALTLDAKEENAVMDAWATLTNNSGCSFSGTSLKLVAGDVQRERTPRRNMVAKSAAFMEADMVAAAPGRPAQESFAQFHVYTVPGAVDLADDGTKQLSLFSAPKIPVIRELSSRFGGGINQLRGSQKQSVNLFLRFANTQKQGLGKPMPGGLVRVFMPTGDGSMLLAGESRLAHTGIGGEIKLGLGRSFDVTAERVQTSYTRLGKRSVKMGWQVKVINGRHKPQQLKLIDTYPGEWKMLATDTKYSRPDAGSLEFNLTVPPTKGGNPMLINYTVQVTY